MDRHPTNEDLSTPTTSTIHVASHVGSSTPDTTGRASLAAWLTAGRMARGLTREHVARVTRIQLRTLARLEEGRFDELPADVFVRGFIRNYARCVGLSVDEALARYAACGFAAAPVASPQAHALLDAMATLHEPSPRAVTTSSVVLVPPGRAAQGTEPVVLRNPGPVSPVAPAAPVAPAVEAVASPVASPVAPTPAAVAPVTRPRRVRDARGRFLRKSEIAAQIEAVSAEAVLDEELEVEITVDDFVAAANELLADAVSEAKPVPSTSAPVVAPVRPVEVAAEPRPVVTVRRSAAQAVPTLTIDDDDPDAAERAREERAEREREKDGGWRSFLPPVLLDQDRGRQGGLTLAVIILLIVATLTLSYLMRRPSSTGEGVTQAPVTSSVPAARVA